MSLSGIMNEIIGTKELANILGKTERSIQRYVKNGILKSIGRGKFNLPQTIKNYIAYELELERKKYKKNDLDIYKIRENREQVELEIKQIELAKIKGEIKDKSDIEDIIVKIASEFRNNLLGMPNSLSQKLLNKKSINQINKILKDWVYRILTDLSKRLDDVI